MAVPPPGGQQPPYGQQPPFGRQRPYEQPPYGPGPPYAWRHAPGEVPPFWQPHYGCSPVDAVKRFFRKYATFSGRASRAEYWWMALVDFVVYAVLGLLGALAGIPGSSSSGDGQWDPGPGFIPFGILIFVWLLGIIVPSIAVTVRRLHDAGMSGLYYLLILIPYAGGLVIFILTLLPPKPEGMRYDQPTA